MSLSDPFIRRPVATSLLACGWLLLGLIAFGFLPISRLPDLDYATFSVYATLPGADPNTVATAVAAPLERRIGQIAGVNELTSSSSMSNTIVSVQFDLSRDLEGATHDIQAAINAAGPELPKDLPTRPVYHKENPSDTPIMLIALSSDLVPLGEVYELAMARIAPKLAQVPGVGSLQMDGSAKSAIRVQADPAYLASMGVSMEDVRALLRTSNANLPKGSLEGNGVSYTLHVNDHLVDPQDYRSLVVRKSNGAAIRLGDVGTVVTASENSRLASWFGTKPAVLLHIRKEVGCNMIETANGIRALLPVLQKTLPPSVKLTLIADRTKTIRVAVDHMERTLLMSIGLVILVVFVFLRRIWATLIPALALPLVLSGTFLFMYVAHFTVDNLTMMALTVAVGFIVDDAIVVIENIVRLIEAGEAPLEAARNGARQIGFTVISMSLALIALFIPLLFTGGIIGRLFYEFVLALTAAILTSAVVSFTFTPMMCARFLAREPEAKGRLGWMSSAMERAFDSLRRGYGRALSAVLRHRTAVLAFTIATMGLAGYLYVVIPKGLFPQEDTGFIVCVTESGQDSSTAAMARRQQEAGKVFASEPAVEAFDSFLRTGNSGIFYVQLKPLAVRRISAEQVVARVRPRLARIEGLTAYPRAVQDLRVGARGGKAQFEYTLQSNDLQQLIKSSSALVRELRKERMLIDVASDQGFNGLQAALVLDRVAMARLGVRFSDVDAMLYDAFGQRQVSTVYLPFDQHHVVLEAQKQFLDDPSSLSRMFLKSASGRLVPLGEIARIERSNAPLMINHQGQSPAITITFSVYPGTALGDAAKLFEATVDRLHFPDSVHGSFQGLAKAFESSNTKQPLLVLGAFLTVYLVLGILYESLIHPLTILSTLPAAGIGALLSLLLFHHELSVVALIGIILLIGVVQRNAIMMVDFALEVQRREGIPADQAIHRACLVRLRPILMTTFAAMFGALPMALQGGVGSELHKPLGISIVGGLIVSQTLTLFSTPVVYIFVDKLHLRRKSALPAHPLASVNGLRPRLQDISG